MRRDRSLESKTQALECELPAHGGDPDFAATYEDIDDDLLRLTFVACHPILSREARVALTLKLVGGLTTAEIARAYAIVKGPSMSHFVRTGRKRTGRSGNQYGAKALRDNTFR
jgi:predicted RNA polymerase sigma factor